MGPNENHLYLLVRDGRPYDAAEELTVTAELPERRIARFEIDATKAGPGHHVLSGASLPAAGNWDLDVAATVSEFDEDRTSVQVRIR